MDRTRRALACISKPLAAGELVGRFGQELAPTRGQVRSGVSRLSDIGFRVARPGPRGALLAWVADALAHPAGLRGRPARDLHTLLVLGDGRPLRRRARLL